MKNKGRDGGKKAGRRKERGRMKKVNGTDKGRNEKAEGREQWRMWKE